MSEEVEDQIRHCLLVPFPIQSHVNPMLQIAEKLSSHGFIVTFVISEFIASRSLYESSEKIRFRSIPDGLPADANRNDFRLLAQVTEMSMPGHLRDVIREINETEAHSVSCVIADFFASWSLDVASDFPISATAAFWPGLVAAYALAYHLPWLLTEHLLPPDGIPQEKKLTRYLESMPEVSSLRLPWLIGSDDDKRFRFQFWQRSESRFKEKAQILLFNSFDDLERPILRIFGDDSRICTVGPLLEPPKDAEKHECLQWMDKQQPRSVVYISFGSSIYFGEKQTKEIAVALEASATKFVWVVREDCRSANLFPEGFVERAKKDGRGYFVAWAPQAALVSHESVACFLSHCGWNSVMETISGGTPLLCLPFVADQFLNSSYVVESWGIGLRLGSVLRDEEVVESSEIRNCFARIMCDSGKEASEIRCRIKRLRDAAGAAQESQGSSAVNFQRLVWQLKFAAYLQESPN